MKTRLLSLCWLLLISGFASGTVTIFYSNNNAPGFEIKDRYGVPLTPGMANKQRDGAYFEIGYYSLATTVNPFAGDWVPMVGPEIGGSNYATIGDNNVNDGAGLFSWLNVINSTTASAAGYELPTVGTLLSFRFYDTQGMGPANFFNAVSSVEWVWPGEDPDTNLIMDLTEDVLLWQGGESTAFRTALPVPEASTAVLAMFGIAFCAFRRGFR